MKRHSDKDSQISIDWHPKTPKKFRNRIVTGDAKELLTQLPDKSVDMVLTDPDYDIDRNAQQWYFEQFVRLARGWIIIFCKPENQWPVEPDQYLFWCKPTSTKNTTKTYSRFVEMILVYGRGHWNPGRHWSQYTNIFMDLVDSSVHPYRKPPSMIERLILNHSTPDHVILDPFAGSGVIPGVAKDHGRNFIAFEINGEYRG